MSIGSAGGSASALESRVVKMGKLLCGQQGYLIFSDKYWLRVPKVLSKIDCQWRKKICFLSEPLNLI